MLPYETASIDAGDGGTFSGHAETLDAFVTHEQVRLNILGEVLDCSNQNRQAIFFALSPRELGHPVWRQLDSIRGGFRCAP